MAGHNKAIHSSGDLSGPAYQQALRDSLGFLGTKAQGDNSHLGGCQTSAGLHMVCFHFTLSDKAGVGQKRALWALHGELAH